ncbi:predicted protein [Coccidioides posadasii str. Silveira]|uniref:Predicted protein n=1 Tax=Coccidioides posadasii (strain RMSCC 757 / Silveira) TaxID=443226 RepID=E9CX87_COCPS|nr:predicted protein [Coccidioides posadasii str. Silveira]
MPVGLFFFFSFLFFFFFPFLPLGLVIWRSGLIRSFISTRERKPTSSVPSFPERGNPGHLLTPGVPNVSVAVVDVKTPKIIYKKADCETTHGIHPSLRATSFEVSTCARLPVHMGISAVP